MDKITDKQGEWLCFKECEQKCILNKTEDEVTCKCKPVTDAMIKLAHYEDLGFTPEELKLSLNPPESIFVIGENDETDEAEVQRLFIDEEMCISIMGKATFWNCNDKYDNYNQIPLSGLGEEYWLTKEQAEAKLREVEK